MKSRYRILGLCLVAVFVACAVASATASAAAPEFFHCVKLTSKTGKYTSKACELKSKTETGEFEKKAVPAGSKIKFTDTVGPTKLYAQSHIFTIACGKGSATGEVSGPKQVTRMQYVFRECLTRPGDEPVEECPLKTIGSEAGEMVMEEVDGELGKVAPAEAPGSEVGLLLKPTASPDRWFKTIAWCFPENAVLGGVIGEVGLTGVMDTAGELRFGVKGGEGKKWKQTIQRFVGGEEVNLIEGDFDLPAGLESSNHLTFEEPIEMT
jgi:hypothetical protein